MNATLSLTDPILEVLDSYVPYVRRRNTPAQLSALQKLFETTPRPTRAQRQVLANEIGMELKSVTNWFQNRRQISRKKSLSSSENDPTRTRLSSSPAHHRHRRSNTPLDRSKISLDRIATLSERPSLTLQLNSQRSPLTPRKDNVQQKNSSSHGELWTRMLSSPAVPLSPPNLEEVRLVALSSRAKLLCPLEWACLRARQKKRVDEDAGRLSALGCHREVDEEREPEVIRLGVMPAAQSDALGLNKTPRSEDVEAAVTLLGFKTRS